MWQPYDPSSPIDEGIERLDQALAARTDARSKRDGKPSLWFPGCDLLTAREHDVLRQIAGAASAKEAARNLGISRRTAENHRAHIMRKLGASNIMDLIRLVMTRKAVVR